MTWDEVLTAGRAGNLQSIEISGEQLEDLKVRLRNDTNEYRSHVDPGTDVEKVLLDNGIALGGIAPNSVEIKYRGSGGEGE